LEVAAKGPTGEEKVQEEENEEERGEAIGVGEGVVVVAHGRC
jgi:hypothetical protein